MFPLAFFEMKDCFSWVKELALIRAKSVLRCFDVNLNLLIVLTVYESQQDCKGKSFNDHAKIFHMVNAFVEILGLFLDFVAIRKDLD